MRVKWGSNAMWLLWFQFSMCRNGCSCTEQLNTACFSLQIGLNEVKGTVSMKNESRNWPWPCLTLTLLLCGRLQVFIPRWFFFYPKQYFRRTVFKFNHISILQLWGHFSWSLCRFGVRSFNLFYSLALNLQFTIEMTFYRECQEAGGLSLLCHVVIWCKYIKCIK